MTGEPNSFFWERDWAGQKGGHMAATDERYLDFLSFCEGLLSQKFKVGWFTGVVDKDDLIQDLYLHFSQRGIENPSRGLIIKVARDKLIDVMRRERRKMPISEPESIESRLRRLSSSLNARDEFELFQKTLTPNEAQIFRFLKDHHKYNIDNSEVSLVPSTAVGAKFLDNPNASIIDEISLFFKISKNAASQRLSRLRTKYFLFREQVTGNDGKRLTYVGFAAENAKKKRQSDELGWLSAAAAADILGITEDQFTNLCRQGKLAAHHAGGDNWFIDPREIERYLRRGPRETRSFKEVMSLLVRRPEVKYIRRAAWESERGLRLEEGTAPLSQNYIKLKYSGIIADCIYQSRTRDSQYTWTPYIPNQDDRSAEDWIRDYPGGHGSYSD
jgi:hypothetical protein